ncbi:MAG: sugar-transfer associated ATP-grasp domain-containing protein [Anaerolineae bacterium]
MLSCSCRYAVSFEDYYWHRFFLLPENERRTYAGTGVAHRFFAHMNDRKRIAIFRSKARFYKHFGSLMGRQSLFLKECSKTQFGEWIKKRPAIVVKPDYGSSGYGIEFVDTTRIDPTVLYTTLLRKGQDIVEEPIVQHEALQELNPSCVNTIRVITVRTETRVDIIGTVLKIGVDGNKVDNMNSGGIASAIDLGTGRLLRPSISLSIGDSQYNVHPDTKVPIPGFQVPLWDSVIDLACCAASVVPSVRTVGWDIAVTPAGAILVEGNDNWGAAFWQKTASKGQIAVLRRYANV